MSRKLFWAVLAATAFCLPAPVSAQFYGSGGCSSCAGNSVAYSQPLYANAGACAPVATCTPIQPVYSACYQTVPVTTYKQEKQTVEVPYYKTEYEDRDVTVYEPVSQQRTVEVPTVSYQTVVENRTVNRDMGRWVTNYQPVSKCAPCQVDARPGMIGWLNRTGVSFRNAFIPNYRTTRQYVPQMMACSVPVTRQVAVRGTQKVVINETKMVAKRTTERVAVQKLAYRKEEVTVSRPVTAYRTVPIGSALAYGGFGYGGTIAFAEDPTTQTAQRPTPDPAFDSGATSNRSARAFPEDPAPRSSLNDSKTDVPFHKSGLERELKPADSGLSPKPTFGEDPGRAFNNFGEPQGSRTRQRSAQPDDRSQPVVLGGWKASRRSENTEATAAADGFRIPGLVANNRE
ncbi:MAG: hypothetical protein R3C49_28110 [Planctomycetaceae bacterium]